MVGLALDPSRRAANAGRAAGTLLLHAFALWVACAATMGLGLAFMSPANALIVHAIAAPVFAAGVAAFYFARFGYTSPLITATVFLSFIAFVDFFLVALVINRSLDMFRSVLGTWLPFAFIFTATAATGWIVNAARPSTRSSVP